MFIARIGYKGDKLYLGSYSKSEEAASAYGRMANTIIWSFCTIKFST
jgi:hypothetical protein